MPNCSYPVVERDNREERVYVLTDEESIFSRIRTLVEDDERKVLWVPHASSIPASAAETESACVIFSPLFVGDKTQPSNIFCDVNLQKIPTVFF